MTSKSRPSGPVVGDGRCDHKLEIDDRRAEELNAVDAAQDLGRGLEEADILVAGPDPPLAAVDCLADLKTGAVGCKPLAEFLHRGPPPSEIGDQIADLRQGKDELVSAAVELAGELFFGVVVGLPRVEPEEDLLHSHRLDRVQMRLRIVGPRP